MALTIEVLQENHSLTDDQLDHEIGEQEMFYVAKLFGGWSQYVETPGLGLSQGEKAQIMEDRALTSNALRMKEALKIWRSPNPYSATFRNLLSILLSFNTQGDVAQEVCKYLTNCGSAGDEQAPAVTPPSITENPSSKDSTDGQSVTFSVVASGAPALSYQWRVRFAPNPAHDINDGDSRGKYSGAHTNVLTVGNLTQADSRRYSVVVTNQAGSVTSGEARLGVARNNSVADNVQLLEHCFYELRESALEYVIEKDIPMARFRRTLMMLPKAISEEHKGYITENYSLFKEAGSVEDIFVHLNFYLSFLDFSLLEHIIKHFGSCDLQQRMKEYSRDVQIFRTETLVADIIPHLSHKPEPPPHFVKLMLKLDFDPETCSLEVLEQHRKKCGSALSLSKFAFFLVALQEGSLVAVWLIPLDIVPSLKDCIKTKSLTFFLNHKILKLSVNEKCLYPFSTSKHMLPSDASITHPVSSQSEIGSQTSVPKQSASSTDFENLFNVPTLDLYQSGDSDPSSPHSAGVFESTVRPLPSTSYRGMFRMCNGKCDGDVNCTFPHNRRELETWNMERSAKRRNHENQLIVPTLDLHQSGDSVSSFPLSAGVFESTVRPLPNTSYRGMFAMCNGMCDGDVNCTFAHNQKELETWNMERSAKRRSVFDPTVRPLPTYRTSFRGDVNYTFPHNRRELETWNMERSAKRRRNPAYRRWNEIPLKEPSVRPEQMRSSLSRQNYKPKFQALLFHENQAHIKILNDKCNDRYTVVLRRAGVKKPEWIRQLDDSRYRRVGYLKMSGDRIAYAVQAASAVSLMHNGSPVCSADILQENYSYTDERLYIGLDSDNVLKLCTNSPFDVSLNDFEFQADVKFKLKQSYFTNLRDSVNQISGRMITKIVPDSTSFQHGIPSVDVSNYGNDCSSDQLDALKAIASCPSAGPPIVITGPFGTGKSYLLAVATSYFFHETKDRHCSARILVCTQQRASADSFMTMYQTRKDEETLCIIQSYGSRDRDLTLEDFYWSVDDFRRFSSTAYCKQRNILAVTTCSTARSLARFVPAGFFTHILIDEGAQMREPEAIASLSMADPIHTKIVIAGDQHQVGPAMLVLGEIPTKYGLSLSLLERLFNYYKSLGSSARSYYATLVTNFRSRNEILSLTKELFYGTELALSDNQEPPTHPDYPYPLNFICSSVNEAENEVATNINEKEAEIVVDVVANIAKNWPSKLWGQLLIPSTLCITSPSRAQLTVINRCLEKKRFSKLKGVRRHPTYDIQGRVFRALFMSTSEPTNSDASSKDPSKSLTDPHVFNTAITRAQSLLVAVGNPFLLLKMEKHMVTRYNGKGKCWSSYLKRCIENGTVTVDPSLKLSDIGTANCLTKLRRLTQHVLPSARSPEVPQHPNSCKVPLLSPPPVFAEKLRPDGSDIPQRKVPQPSLPLVCDVKLGPPEAIPLVSQLKGSASLIGMAKKDNCRSKVNDFFTKKLITKPVFSVSGDQQKGFVCTLTFNIYETCKLLTVETHTPMPTKAKSREVAAGKALEIYNPKIENREVKGGKGPVRPIPARSISVSRRLKQPLALLKELCDKQRLKYDMLESKVAGDHFQFTVFVKNKDSLETQFGAKGKPKQSKKEARHSAAKEAIAYLGGQCQRFEIEEPPSASFGAPNSTTQKETEGESVSGSAVVRASPHDQGAVVTSQLRRLDEEHVL